MLKDVMVGVYCNDQMCEKLKGDFLEIKVNNFLLKQSQQELQNKLESGRLGCGWGPHPQNQV